MPGCLEGPSMPAHPADPDPVSRIHHDPQRWVRPGVAADAPLLDAWLMTRAPLAVPEARARRLALDALLEQGGHGICLMAGTDAVQAVLPVTLVHSLSTGGRVAMATEWWPPESGDADDWLGECCVVLAEWCRAHGIRYAFLAPGLVVDATQAPAGFVRGPEGLWRRNLVPTAKHLG